MAGIHLHPHDVLDEGMGAVLKRIDGMVNIDHLFVAVNTIFERNPYPTGRLPHNPKHEYVTGDGTLHVNISAVSERLGQRLAAGVLNGDDPLRQVKEATAGGRYQVIAWANILNGDFTGDVAGNQVVDFRGRPVEHWLCPNGPDVADYWQAMFSAIRARYGCDTFLIDRIRFPDWAGKTVNPAGLFTCFCSHCQTAMRAEGLPPEAVQARLNELSATLKDGEFGAVADALLHDALLQRWQTFRQRSVTGLVRRMLEQAERSEEHITFWLDLWPPAYSWILGQDYSELTRYSDTLKHFPYHRLGGGADVQGLINYVARDDTEQERAFSAFKRLFSLPYELDYKTFKANGFPIDFVARQNNLVRRQSRPGTFIYSGIQMWNLPPEQLLEAIKAAETSECDDLLYYCYGWADQSLFDTVGEHYLRGEK